MRGFFGVCDYGTLLGDEPHGGGLTLEEPDIPGLVFKRGVHGVRDSFPVPGGEGRVAPLQVAVADPPHVTAPEEEQLATDHGHGVEVCVAGVRLEHRSGTGG